MRLGFEQGFVNFVQIDYGNTEQTSHFLLEVVVFHPTNDTPVPSQLKNNAIDARTSYLLRLMSAKLK